MMSDLRKTDISIHSIGSQVMKILATKKYATVFGITSHGIFLNFENEKMIFLSCERYQGPLTANVSEESKLVSTISQGETATIFQDEIFFSDSGVYISISSAKVWDPPFPTEFTLQINERIGLICHLAQNVYQQKKPLGLSETLPRLTGFGPEYSSSDRQIQGLIDEISSIRKYLIQGDWISLVQPILSFLGMGSGLTPSGDDFVIGLLLSLNRWKSLFQLDNRILELNRNVVEAAYRSTTTLSANLIECATLGLADERLIQAVDFLATGKYHQDDILPGILSWGNSSGVDALVGMITAFLSSNSS
jgi:hypothetical protein